MGPSGEPHRNTGISAPLSVARVGDAPDRRRGRSGGRAPNRPTESPRQDVVDLAMPSHGTPVAADELRRAPAAEQVPDRPSIPRAVRPSIDLCA